MNDRAITVAGIDPGKTGAMVVLFPDNTGLVYRVPTIKTPKVTPAYGEWWRTWTDGLAFGVDRVVIEAVSARPTQGVTSMFNFGQTLGFVKAIACSAECPIAYPTPSTWKAKMGLSGADKDASREKVRQLLPALSGEVARKMDDGVAEAALLALYCRLHLF